MARCFSVIVVLNLLLCFLSGCFTIGTQVTETPPGSRVFSGTRAHVMAMASGRLPWNEYYFYWVPVGYGTELGVLWWHPLDLPLSCAADIVILPYTLTTQLIWGDFKEKAKEEQEAPSTRSTEK